MAKSRGGWFKPYILNPHNIERVVEEGTPGVYVVGHIGADKKLRVRHIKASRNVKEELRALLGKYHIFMYRPFKHSLGSVTGGQMALWYS